VIDPPEQRTYACGDTIRATLIIRWRDGFDAVVLEFHKLYSTFRGRSGTGPSFGVEARSGSPENPSRTPRLSLKAWSRNE
jgi:hypothetical protein